MELVIAVFALVAAAASAWYARGANVRADTANLQAAEALKLQSLIDAREREFRAVEWSAMSTLEEDRTSETFSLTNVGDTDARSVTVVLNLYKERETHELGDIPAKQTAHIESRQLTEWMSGARDHEIVHPGYRVHWSSPLGQVSDETKPMRTVEDFIDFGPEEPDIA